MYAHRRPSTIHRVLNPFLQYTMYIISKLSRLVLVLCRNVKLAYHNRISVKGHWKRWVSRGLLMAVDNRNTEHELKVYRVEVEVEVVVEVEVE